MSPQAFTPPTVHFQTLSVSFEYPVLFCSNALDPANQHLRWAIDRIEPQRTHSVVFCVDSAVANAWPQLAQQCAAYCSAHSQQLRMAGPLVLVPGGESCKNDPRIIDRLVAAFADAKLDRQACVVGIGGGAVLDAVGYAAALVHRGLRMVRLPTTVLAQNDAGVGVKNGVNAHGAKNFLGTFAPPFAVLNDGQFLRTLPERDLRAGLAEAVKVACIRDAEFFAWLEQNADRLGAPGVALDETIRRCALLHLDHIRTGGDPFEMGSARPLDYGHWAAHRLEMMSDNELRHGEAVAIGMLLDARYACSVGLLAYTELERLATLLDRLGLPTYDHRLANTTDGHLDVLTGLREFREHLGGQLTVTQLVEIGRGVEVNEMDERQIFQAVQWLRQRCEPNSLHAQDVAP